MAALKILILTDFSELSKVAIQYGMKMGTKLDAEFTILNVARIDGVPKSNLKFKQIEKALLKVTEEEGKVLVEELKTQYKNKFPIQFKAIKSHTVADTVRRYTQTNPTSLIIMGSKGASKFKKAVLGGTTVSVIDACHVPVLAIPEKAQFTNFKNVVYASDLKNVQKELDTLVPFAKIFDSSIHMIHVVESIDKGVEAKREEVKKIIQKVNYPKLDLELLIDDDIPWAIDKYIINKKAELLCTFTHELNLFEKIFARSVTRKLAYQGIIPLLTFKRKSV